MLPAAANRHYVLGNHCVDTLTKEEFLAGVGQKRSYYSFDAGGAPLRRPRRLLPQRRQALWPQELHMDRRQHPGDRSRLAQARPEGERRQAIVFAHQRLDVTNDYGVKNAADVRKVLEESGKVLAVFQGHSHKNDYKEIGGIHYCTLVAMIEGSGREQRLLGVGGPGEWCNPRSWIHQAEGI